MGAYLQRTFGYRRRYVDAVAELAPNRAVLAVSAEMARLAFVVVGSALVALVFWVLTAGAFERLGPVAFRSLLFAVCALAAAACAIAAAIGIVHAVADLGRVRSNVAR
ncbi:MAG: hypothetical protein JO060_11260 [Candidatus Eremiobacteraeota bacterium]|nr:hypothetical protein [Candidatus Eremiobacteraeota bacterium]MBV9648030.1 hypothetical protein [Candidatus Eremiobacteraeota bacterium]